jgi:hypothetical protein
MPDAVRRHVREAARPQREVRLMTGSNYCYICGKKIPKGATICDECNKGPEVAPRPKEAG